MINLDSLLQGGNLYFVAAAVVILLLRTQGANSVVNTVLGVVRGVTNTPGDDAMDTDVKRYCAAKCLLGAFAKRGASEVADMIRKNMHVLIDEGDASEK